MRKQTGRRWTARRQAAVATIVVVGLAGGAWAGIDAAGQVDGHYRALPTLRASRAPAATPWQPAESPAIVAAPPASGMGEVGRDERAFFDAGSPDEDAVKTPRVRVHRLPSEAMPDYRVRPLPPSDEGEWVEAPVPAYDPPRDDPVG